MKRFFVVFFVVLSQPINSKTVWFTLSSSIPLGGFIVETPNIDLLRNSLYPDIIDRYFFSANNTTGGITPRLCFLNSSGNNSFVNNFDKKINLSWVTSLVYNFSINLSISYSFSLVLTLNYSIPVSFAFDTS